MQNVRPHPKGKFGLGVLHTGGEIPEKRSDQEEQHGQPDQRSGAGFPPRAETPELNSIPDLLPAIRLFLVPGSFLFFVLFVRVLLLR